jgi:hypothetical protein
MTALTRGPLPARVYWTRRIMVLGTALLLVFGLARLLTGGSDASAPEAGAQAVQAGAAPTTSAATTTASPPPGVTQAREPRKPQKKKSREPVLAEPDGPCVDEDIAVTPEVEKAVAGSPVLIAVGLRSIDAEACTWQVSPETMTLKITSGKDDIWLSRQCPGAVPTRNVVVRQDATATVRVRWSARRSDDECTRQTTWALPGWYHVAVAALAGEPSDLQFELERPRREVVTQTVAPQPDRDDKNGKNDKNDEKDQPKHR